MQILKFSFFRVVRLVRVVRVVRVVQVGQVEVEAEAKVGHGHPQLGGQD